MKKAYVFKGLVSMLFISVLSLPLFEAKSVNAQENPFDYSRKDSQSTVKIASSDIVKMVINEDNLYEVEEIYLKDHGMNLMYENRIPSGNVETIYSEDSLLVYARPYSYIDQQNRTITWYPYQAKLSETSKEFTFDSITKEYLCKFDQVYDEEQIEVVYNTTFSLDKSAVNTMLNSTYYAAESYVLDDIVGKTNEINNKNQKEYNQNLSLYNKYLVDLEAYNENIKKYEEYFSKKQEYDEKKILYNEYVDEYNKYVNQLEAYNNYLIAYEKYIAYQNYLLEKEKYDKAYEAYITEYEKNKETYDKINYQLSVMDLITTEMTSLNRTIYNAIMGGTVTLVLANKETLKKYGVSEYQIDKANDATVALRQLFSHYYGLSSNESKYAFYRKYYNDIKNNLISLLQALDTLYQYDIVKLAIQTKDRVPQYNILLSQLVVACNAISITPVDDGTANRKIYTNKTLIGGKTVMENLEYDCDFVENDEWAYPSLKIVYKEPPVEPTPIEEVPYQEAPNKVNHPGVEPTKVENPGEQPVEVLKPEKPPVVEKPIEPELITIDPKIISLIEAYEKQYIKKRSELIKDYKLEISTSFTKQFKNINTVTVEFHDQNGNYLAKYTTDSGSYIDYDKSLPSTQGDEIYSDYAFSHWVYKDSDGNDLGVLDINNVTESGHVYPVFVGKTKRKYEISWIVDGKITTELYEYGDMPTYKQDISRVTDGIHYFEFDSWDSSIDPVTENKKYRAKFKNYYLIDVDGKTPSIKYTTDKIIINCSEFDNIDLRMHKFFDEMITSSNEKSIQIVTTKVSVLFSASAISRLKKNDFDRIEVVVVNNDKNDYSYKINLYDSSDNLLLDEYNMNVTFSGEFDITRSDLYEINTSGEIKSIRATIRKNTIVFKMNSNCVYEIYPIYSIAKTSNKNVIISVDKELAKANQEVSFEVSPSNEGIEIIDIIITDHNNNLIPHADGKFIMPTGDVFISVNTKQYTYTIRFSVNDEIISYGVYKHGDEIRVPDDPFIMGNAQYTYTFIGWDKEITAALCDVTYYAVFDVVEVVQPEPSPTIKTLDTIITVGAILLVPLVAIIIIFAKKKRREFIKTKISQIFKKLSRKSTKS